MQMKKEKANGGGPQIVLWSSLELVHIISAAIAIGRTQLHGHPNTKME